MPLVLRVSETGTTTVSIEATDLTAQLLLSMVIGMLKQSGPIVIEAAAGERSGEPAKKFEHPTIDLSTGTVDLGPLMIGHSTASNLETLAAIRKALNERPVAEFLEEATQPPTVWTAGP